MVNILAAKIAIIAVFFEKIINFIVFRGLLTS